MALHTTDRRAASPAPDTDQPDGSMSPEQSFIQTAQRARRAEEAAETEQEIERILSAASESSDAIATRLQRIKAADNPLLEAAQPLLLTLARLPEMRLESRNAVVLHALLVREIESFRMLCTQADVARDQVISASFALCIALDEAANCTDWGGVSRTDAAPMPVTATAAAVVAETGDAQNASFDNSAETEQRAARHAAYVAHAAHVDSRVGVWAGQMLAAHFHEDTEGGSKIFMLIGRLLTLQPEGYIALLEVLYRILSLGFEGQYRNTADGARLHEAVRQRIYHQIAQARPQVARELSPQWQGVGTGKFKLLRSIPVWITASVLGLALFSMFSWHKFQLLRQSDALAREIIAMGRVTPTPIPMASLRLASLLRQEIAQGLLSVDEDGRRSRMTFKGDTMFVTGLAAVQPRMHALLTTIASEINSLPVMVYVTGHTDNVPVRLPHIPDNQALSEQRAANVAKVLQAGGVAAQQIHASGQAERMPLADNASAAGRAANRRVEIEIVVQNNTAAALPSVAAGATAATVASNGASR